MSLKKYSAGPRSSSPGVYVPKIVWICQNQLGRRNLTKEQKTYLIGKEYEAQKKTVGAPVGNTNSSNQCAQNEHIETVKRTSELIAKERGIGKDSVKRAEHFARGLDAADEVKPGFRKGGEIQCPVK